MTQFEIHDEVWIADLQKQITQYTDSLYDQLYDEEPGEDFTETLSGEPFCGCDVCFWRETLTVLIPELILGYQGGKVTLVENGGAKAKPEA